MTAAQGATLEHIWNEHGPDLDGVYAPWVGFSTCMFSLLSHGSEHVNSDYGLLRNGECQRSPFDSRCALLIGRAAAPASKQSPRAARTNER